MSLAWGIGSCEFAGPARSSLKAGREQNSLERNNPNKILARDSYTEGKNPLCAPFWPLALHLCHGAQHFSCYSFLWCSSGRLVGGNASGKEEKTRL